MIINSDAQITSSLRSPIIVVNCCVEIIGMLTGNVELKENAQLVVRGIVTGNIYVCSTSKAIIYGTINGKIINFGKTVVQGTLSDTISGTGITTIEPGSIINGVRQ